MFSSFFFLGSSTIVSMQVHINLYDFLGQCLSPLWKVNPEREGTPSDFAHGYSPCSSSDDGLNIHC